MGWRLRFGLSLFVTVSLCLLALQYQIFSSFDAPETPPALQTPQARLSQKPNTKNRLSSRKLNRFLVVGKFGLGHRLSKLSAAYHLVTQQFQNGVVPVLEIHWGNCQKGKAKNNKGNGTDVFVSLFQKNKFLLSDDKIPTRNDFQDKIVLIRNDVSGYYAGQSYKNFQLVPSRRQLESWKSKLDSDWSFFETHLIEKFTGKQQLEQFQQEHDWDASFVIGLHVRAGNGEKEHFVEANRNIVGQEAVEDLCQLILLWVEQNDFQQTLVQEKKTNIIVFVATDTADLIPIIQKSLLNHEATSLNPISIQKVIVYPQKRLQANQGVSYSAWVEGDDCWQGWMASTMDMMLLSHTDMLIASQRSTFTQIVPRSAVFHKQNKFWPFCEVDHRRMTCFQDELSWFFRRSAGMRTVSIGDNDNTGNESVAHKLLVHIPDVDTDPLQEQATEFLKSFETVGEVFPYGEEFSRKYRGKNSFQATWAFSLDHVL